MRLLSYVVRRVLSLAVLVLMISLIIFSIFLVVPGDPAKLMLGEGYTPTRYQEMREYLGLDDPLHVRYLNFVNDLIHGNLGYSLLQGRRLSATPMIMDAFKATLELSVLSTIISVIVGLSAGIISAVKRNSIFDYVSMSYALTGVCLPVFWTGILLIIVFSVMLGWFPLSGRINVLLPFQRITGLYILDSILTGNWAALKSCLWHMMLPAFALSLETGGVIARMTRSNMIEALSKNYVTTARSVGFPERVVIFKYVLRNAMIPISTVIGMRFARHLGGTVLTETVFAWPGIGRLAVSAIMSRDYPVVVGCAVIFAIAIVIINLIVDILYTYLDPRIEF